MKNILVMGAAIEQLPAIITAKRMGHKVGVIDYNAQAIGIPYADIFFNTSTIDIVGVERIAKEFKADAIITLATDMPMVAVANATNKLGLVGISVNTAEICTNKYKMIEAFKAHSVASPWYQVVCNREELELLKKRITYPCIIKPVDNSASRGVMLVRDVTELGMAYEYSVSESKVKQVIIEEYLIGPEVSVEVLVYKGTPHILAITDKYTTGAPNFVELGHNQPSLLSSSSQNMIIDLTKSAVKAVGIENGPAHVEIIVTNSGPKMVELGARLGGDCITSHLVCLSTGIDMIEETIKLLCGEKPDTIAKHQKGAAIRFLTSSEMGILDKVEGINDAAKCDGIVQVSMIMKCGDRVGCIKSSDDRIAYVIAQDNEPTDAIHSCQNAIGKLHVLVHD